MALIDNLRRPGRQALPPINPIAPGIEAKVREAEARLCELDRNLAQAALDAVTGGKNAEDRYADLRARVNATHEEVARLTAAHRAALEKDEAALRVHHAHLHAVQLQNLQLMAAKVPECIDRGCAALVTAVAEFSKALHHADGALMRAQAAQFEIPPSGSGLSEGEILNAWRAQLFKLTAKDGGAWTFPGASAPDAGWAWQPENIPDQASVIREAVSAILARVAALREEVKSGSGGQQ